MFIGWCITGDRVSVIFCKYIVNTFNWIFVSSYRALFIGYVCNVDPDQSSSTWQWVVRIGVIICL